MACALLHLVLNRRDRLQIIGDRQRVFFGHVLVTVTDSLDDFVHEPLRVIEVGLGAEFQQLNDIFSIPLTNAALCRG